MGIPYSLWLTPGMAGCQTLWLILEKEGHQNQYLVSRGKSKVIGERGRSVMSYEGGIRQLIRGRGIWKGEGPSPRRKRQGKRGRREMKFIGGMEQGINGRGKRGSFNRPGILDGTGL